VADLLSHDLPHLAIHCLLPLLGDLELVPLLLNLIVRHAILNIVDRSSHELLESFLQAFAVGSFIILHGLVQFKVDIFFMDQPFWWVSIELEGQRQQLLAI